MGQAKQRGPLNERVAAAKARIDALRPQFIICNDCKHEITEIVDLNTRGMAGIDVAFAGICPVCNGTTYAIKGSPEAVETLMIAISADTGEVPLIGVQ